MSTDQQPPPPQIETTPETRDVTTLKDPKPNQTPPMETETETETSSKTKPVAEEEAVETLQNQASSATVADPRDENETETSSKNKPVAEEEAVETLNNQASSADPHVENETETSSKNKPVAEEEVVETIQNQASSATDVDPRVENETETNSKNKPVSEEEAFEALKNQASSATGAADPRVENETAPKSSSVPPNYVAPLTLAPEKDENKLLRKESPAEISPAEDETTSKQSSQAIPDATPRTKRSSSWDKLKPPFQLSNLLQKLRERLTSKSVYASRLDKKEMESPSKLKQAVEEDEKELESTSKLKQAVEEDKKELDTPSKLKQAVQEDVEFTEKGFEMLKYYQENMMGLLQAIKKLEAQWDQGRQVDDLSKYKQDLIKLRLQFSLKYRLESNGVKKFHFSSESKKSTSQEVLSMMPKLHKDSFVKTSPEFKDFEARYNDLDPKLKLCLLCFSVFPENQIIKKRMMVQWWVVEGFACEKEANENFIQLIRKGFIEPVNENRSLSVGSCRMHPFYRLALVMLAEKANFLNFGSEGEPTQNFAGSFQTCLVGEGLISYDDLKNESVSVLDLENVHLLINIKEPILEFKRDWFSKMKNVNVLYLGRWETLVTDHREVDDTGRWETLATGHREVDDTDFLDDLKNMKYVKFLSLQGVSNMIDLPESITKMTNLEILDISACHNLETIPKRIGCLRFLTQLDMSDCYLLEHMPESILNLQALKVLKGFVVRDKPGKKSCKLDDLKGLKNLVKLCIYTGLREFPNKDNVKALKSLTGLRKLTITWGGSAFNAEAKEEKEIGHDEIGLPAGLEKLDLRYFPTSRTPDWLKVGNMKGLEKLKKLYVRAGKLSDLGQYQESDCWDWPLKKDAWRVEVLRLRYLPYIEMEWRQVQELFPDLVYLEQVGCPKLTLFPCDANGVWMNKKPK